MQIAKIVKRLFYGKDALYKERIKKLKTVPKEQRRQEFGAIMHDLCVQCAADFVKDEFNKNDSPFKEIDAARLFHEIVVINYWIADKVMGGEKRILQGELHNNYFRHFEIEDAHRKEKFLNERYAVYYDNWDDDIGDHKGFGLKAAGHIYGEEKEGLMDQASFWIVFYANDIMKRFFGIKKTCRFMRIKI
jgi:hypothetical protein